MFVQINTIKQVIDFVGIASKYKGDINIEYGRTMVDGKSLMGMFMLNYPQRISCTIVNSFNEEDVFKGELKLRGYQVGE